jgi:hypothetical protein
VLVAWPPRISRTIASTIATVAIKVLREDLGATLGPDRFLAEIKTTARLQHLHILPLLDSEKRTACCYVTPSRVAGYFAERLTRD